jgi:hypothetical protein
MAKRSAAEASEKVREAVVTNMDELDMEKFSVKQRGKEGDLPFFYTSYDHRQLVLKLPSDKWFRVPFPIDAYDEVSKALFVSVEVDTEVAAVIQKVEDVIKAQVLTLVPKAEWKDSVRQNGAYDPVFKTKLVIKALRETQLSNCTVREFGKAPVRNISGEALMPLLKANRGFQNAKVKLGVALAKVYVMHGKYGEVIAGANWRITNMMADLEENVATTYADIFADDEFPAQ